MSVCIQYLNWSIHTSASGREVFVPNKNKPINETAASVFIDYFILVLPQTRSPSPQNGPHPFIMCYTTIHIGKSGINGCFSRFLDICVLVRGKLNEFLLGWAATGEMERVGGMGRDHTACAVDCNKVGHIKSDSYFHTNTTKAPIITRLPCPIPLRRSFCRRAHPVLSHAWIRYIYIQAGI